MRRMYVLGANGMLGRMACRYFGQRGDWSVVGIAERFNHENLIDHFRRYDAEPAAVFVNAIGAIPQKVSGAQDFIVANVLLPLELARTLGHQHRLVHPSTDCVFRGDLGRPYSPASEPDANDMYGWSKLQAERVLMTRPDTLLIRTSIVGPGTGAASGLMQWFLSQPRGATLKGFTNHLWNGMTTLQWCVEVERQLTLPADSAARLVQFGSRESYSKCEMLNLFKHTFRPDIVVEPTEHTQKVDRRLEPEIEVPALPEQLEHLRALLELP